MLLLVKDGEGDKTPIDNYRGITISTVISILFELFWINVLGDKLNTSNLKFGFKKKSSCSHAVSAMRKTINYYNEHLESTVTVCALRPC